MEYARGGRITHPDGDTTDHILTALTECTYLRHTPAPHAHLLKAINDSLTKPEA